MLKVIGYFLLIELLQLVFVIVICHLVWRFVLRDRLPKAWVENLIMMGLVPKRVA